MSGDTWELSKRYDNSHDTPSPLNSQSTAEGILVPFAVSFLLFSPGDLEIENGVCRGPSEGCMRGVK